MKLPAASVGSSSSKRGTPSWVPEHRAADVQFRRNSLIVQLIDGRAISTPLDFYPTLLDAAPGARRRWRLIGDGVGIEWPGLDLQLSTEGIIAGRREHVPSADFSTWLGRRQAELGMPRRT
jgi:hypothetical protein